MAVELSEQMSGQIRMPGRHACSCPEAAGGERSSKRRSRPGCGRVHEGAATRWARALRPPPCGRGRPAMRGPRRRERGHDGAQAACRRLGRCGVGVSTQAHRRRGRPRRRRSRSARARHRVATDETWSLRAVVIGVFTPPTSLTTTSAGRRGREHCWPISAAIATGVARRPPRLRDLRRSRRAHPRRGAVARPASHRGRSRASRVGAGPARGTTISPVPPPVRGGCRTGTSVAVSRAPWGPRAQPGGHRGSPWAPWSTRAQLVPAEGGSTWSRTRKHRGVAPGRRLAAHRSGTRRSDLPCPGGGEGRGHVGGGGEQDADDVVLQEVVRSSRHAGVPGRARRSGRRSRPPSSHAQARTTL